MKFRLLRQRARFVIALLVAKLMRGRVPLKVILCVTNQCNLNCWYCYGEHPYRHDCHEFTTDELLSVVGGLHKLGTQLLQLQGGEPLLRNDLPIIINEARRLGMSCDMVTNGILILRKPEVIRLLDTICISLDGPPDINDQNRGKGTHAQVVEGIKFASACGLPVRISAVLTEASTTEHIDWLVAFARKHHTLLNFSPSFEFVKRFHPGKFVPHVIPDEQIRRLLRYIIQYKLNGAPIQYSINSYKIALRWPFLYQKRRARSEEFLEEFIHPKCYHGDYVVFIDSDGSVYPCCNFWGRSKLNIRTHGLHAAVTDLDRDGCETCYIMAYIDRNLFFDMRPSVWWNYIAQNLKEVLR